MTVTSCLCLLLIVSVAVLASITQATIYDNDDVISLDYLRSLTPSQAADLVKQQFTFGYDAYMQYAWGCDELYPQTKACKNAYTYSLMWTPIDSLGIKLCIFILNLMVQNLTYYVHETGQNIDI